MNKENKLRCQGWGRDLGKKKGGGWELKRNEEIKEWEKGIEVTGILTGREQEVREEEMGVSKEGEEGSKKSGRT